MVFRCDGDDSTGAGRVVRCLQIASAFRAVGEPVVFVGRYSGTAGRLLAESGFPTSPPTQDAAGVPASASGAVIASSARSDGELVELGRTMPVAILGRRDRPPPVTAAVDYRLDAHRVQPSPTTTPILGADYAPVDPALTWARRRRGFERVLVILGPGGDVDESSAATLAALKRLAEVEALIVGAGEQLPDITRLRDTDAVVACAGELAYDLACAGIPAVLEARDPGEQDLARAFHSAGTALVAAPDAPDGTASAILQLADASGRARMTAAGPALD